jgi:hypothetical protein
MLHMKTVKVTTLLLVLGLGCIVLSGQEPTQPRVFTSAQAEAGRMSYENTCARCHTYTLLGRKGGPGELPPVSSLSEADQKFIGNPNHVPPLAGQAFLDRWGDKTVSQLIARFEITLNDPSFNFKNVDDNTVVNITAYVLQVNGAKAGNEALSRSNRVLVNSVSAH